MPSDYSSYAFSPEPMQRHDGVGQGSGPTVAHALGQAAEQAAAEAELSNVLNGLLLSDADLRKDNGVM